ncbi:GNAT family N-acetyltransferase [Paenibacillus beijingensis]|uniref:GNAT family N-acetyltransferase n=1 Tax=Paenibacillus beijingensis TaxID=1126833 RepID=UPI0006984E3A|nr:GNAT family N-acetyltransferase [Paenibacillus beijingensis]
MIGYVMAVGGSARRIRHSAYLVAGIRQAYTGQGIGRRLFEALERWRPDTVTRFELTVMVHNKRAIALYRKMGFVIEGIKKNAMIVDGVYTDEYLLVRTFE